VRALENKKIAEFYEGQVIDLVKIEEEAQKYHSNTKLPNNLTS